MLYICHETDFYDDTSCAVCLMWFFSFSSSVCPPGKYKYGVGDDKCQPCPAHSKAPDQGMSECRCNTGYYRSPKDPKSVPCTREYYIAI